MIDLHDAIAAFVDGERVDQDRLKEALADPAGRDYLVDLLALRELVNAEGAALGGRPVPVRDVARSRINRLSWIAAAAMLAIGTFGGYVAGMRSVDRARPSTPVVVERAPLAAPAPTRVIRLEPGVNWEEKRGSD
jgi:hypothetical protein